MIVATGYTISPTGSPPGVIGKYSFGTFIAIAPNWILTARHVAGTPIETTGFYAPRTTNGDVYTITHTFERSPWDLILFRLSSGFVNYHQRYNDGSIIPTGTNTLLGGWGQVPAVGAVVVDNDGARAEKWGANILSANTFNIPAGLNAWTTTFTNPSAGGVASEGCACLHDSGGGIFILDNGVWKLAGWITLGVGAGSSGVYGSSTCGGYMLSPEINNWITSQINYTEDLLAGRVGTGGTLRRLRRLNVLKAASAGGSSNTDQSFGSG